MAGGTQGTSSSQSNPLAALSKLYTQPPQTPGVQSYGAPNPQAAPMSGAPQMAQSPLVGLGMQGMMAGQQGQRPPQMMPQHQFGGAAPPLPQMQAPGMQQAQPFGGGGMTPQMMNQILAQRMGLFGGGQQ